MPELAREFEELTRGFEPAHWLTLGLIAGEGQLPASALEAAWPPSPARRGPTPLAAFLGQAAESGLIVDAPRLERPLFRRGLSQERCVCIATQYWTLLLRKLGSLGLYDSLDALSKTPLGQTRVSFALALFTGNLKGAIRNLPLLDGYGFARGPQIARELLLASVAMPFDAHWFVDTWGAQAPAVAEHVLSDALEQLWPVEDLYLWFAERPSPTPGACQVLAEHAVLRGKPESFARTARLVDTRTRALFAAAERYQRRDLAGAHAELELAVSKNGGQGKEQRAFAGTPALAPLFGLLLLSRDDPALTKLAPTLVRSAKRSRVFPDRAKGESTNGSAKAFLGLVKNLKRPGQERARLDVHQEPPDAPAWQLFLRGLDVLLHEKARVTRAGWAKRLDSEAATWERAGYHWFAAESTALARALDAALPRASNSSAPSALYLCDLLTPKPEWQKTLVALAGLVDGAEKRSQPEAYRVAWFLDMAHGCLNKPALEEYQAGRGWSSGRRVDWRELNALVERLPSEDAAAVRRAAAYPYDESAVLEALIGHPRVYNGARGRLAVEVVRGECRVESRQEHGHLLVRVEPENAKEGLNIVVESETRLKLVRVTKVMAEVSALMPAGVRVPEANSLEAFELLSKLAEHMPVNCEGLSEHQHVTANSTPCLRISAESGAFLVELGVRPFGSSGRFFLPGTGRVRLTVHAEGGLRSTERDLASECERSNRLIALCPTLEEATRESTEETGATEPTWQWVLGEERLFSLLGELKAGAPTCALEWQNQRPLEARGRVSLSALRGRLRPVKGWYLASGSLRIDDRTELDLSELVRLPYTKSGRFLRLRDGDFLEVEQRAQKVLATLRAQGAAGHAGVDVSPAALDALEVLTAPDSGFLVDEVVQERLRRLRELEAESPDPPPTLRATLRPYQVEGYRWLVRLSELGFGACLADDMGLGKTLQAAALLLWRKARGRTLIVAPTSVVSNWLRELARFAASLDCREYAGKDRARLLSSGLGDVVVASYALLQQDAAELSRVEWSTVILDEAQFIKNPHSARAKAAFALRAECRVALTGTPVENHLGDLWSIFRFLNPTLLGAYKSFFQRFLRPIERDRDPECRQALRQLIRPFLLRRLKSQVLEELPPLITVRHEVRLGKEESVRYALLCKNIYEKLKTAYGKREHKLEILAEITRLRRFCCHPRLVYPDANSEASKLRTLLELVHELRDNGHRALVFSQFVDFLALMREQLDEQGIAYQYLDGSTPRQKRQLSVDAFQAGVGDLFLISLKAGGFGLNLAAADYVIQTDPWWNPAVEAQATDRAHRIGQLLPVTVYRLITKDTIEDRIDELQRDKRVLAEALFDSTDMSAEVSLAELRALLLEGQAGLDSLNVAET